MAWRRRRLYPARGGGGGAHLAADPDLLEEEGQVGYVLLVGHHGPSGGDFRQKFWIMTAAPYCRPVLWRHTTGRNLPRQRPHRNYIRRARDPKVTWCLPVLERNNPGNGTVFLVLGSPQRCFLL